MAVPERIPIKRVPGYRTEYAGRWARGQFLGNVISQPDRWAVAEGKPDWREYSRWFAYLHEFDRDGRYLRDRRRIFLERAAGDHAAPRVDPNHVIVDRQLHHFGRAPEHKRIVGERRD